LRKVSEEHLVANTVGLNIASYGPVLHYIKWILDHLHTFYT